MFYHESAFLLRAGFGKMAAFSRISTGKLPLRMSGKTCFESFIDRLSCGTGFVYSPETVLGQNFQVLGDGLYLHCLNFQETFINISKK